MELKLEHLFRKTLYIIQFNTSLLSWTLDKEYKFLLSEFLYILDRTKEPHGSCPHRQQYISTANCFFPGNRTTDRKSCSGYLYHRNTFLCRTPLSKSKRACLGLWHHSWRQGTPTFVIVAHAIPLAALCIQRTTLTLTWYGHQTLISLAACSFTDWLHGEGPWK
jgi:hypothetical protein